VPFIIQHLPYNLLTEIGFTSDYSVSLAGLEQ